MRCLRLPILGARLAVLPLGALLLAACEGERPAGNPASTPQTSTEATPAAREAGPPVGSLDWALTGPWRPQAERALDATRRPHALLAFMGVEPSSHVLEAWPGGGWHAAILAPYLHAGGGAYRAALSQTSAPLADEAATDTASSPDPAAEGEGLLRRAFLTRFEDRNLFGPIAIDGLGPQTPPLDAPASVDIALTADDVHAWMALSMAEKAFADLFAVLKPGGFLVVIEARAADQGPQDPRAPSGYVQTRHVEALAQEAGFVLAARSDMLANPSDDGDHPFGVWTLEPFNRTAPLGQPRNPEFDRSAFDAIGEPDRMLLLFRKPMGSETPAP